MYPLQNRRASKSATHGFASKSDTRHRKKHLRQQVLFSVIFALRRVLLLRSDIRLTPSGIRFASFGGEYNITAEQSGAISLLRKQKYHADEVSISLKTISTPMFFEILLMHFCALRGFRIYKQIRTSETVEMFTKLWYNIAKKGCET